MQAKESRLGRGAQGEQRRIWGTEIPTPDPFPPHTNIHFAPTYGSEFHFYGIHIIYITKYYAVVNKNEASLYVSMLKAYC